MSYLINSNESADDGIRRVLLAQNSKMLELLRDWRSDPADRIHRARQSCKRIRALVRLIRPAARYAYEVENRFYRDLQRSVAYARDAAAMVEALDLIGADVSEPLLVQSVAQLRAALAVRAAAEVTRSESVLANSVELACQELESAARRIEHLPLDELRRRDLRRGAERTAERCAAGFARVRHMMLERPGTDHETPDAFHNWRKHVKYASYQHRLLAESGTVWSVAEGALLRELADVLGQSQDLVLLDAFFRAQPDTLRVDTHVQRLRKLVAERQVTLRHQALDLGSRLFPPPETRVEAADDLAAEVRNKTATHR